MDVEIKKMVLDHIWDIHHLKEHDEGIGDGKADAEDKYEIVDDEDLVKCDHTSMSKLLTCVTFTL